jgi:hypothetical protein
LAHPLTVAARELPARKTPSEGIVNVAVLATAAIGVVLRASQFSVASSLTLDEIALAKGVLSLDIQTLLTQPLPVDQVAPKGFLVAQKLAVLAFGPSGYALRLVPFIGSLVALWAFAHLVRLALPPVGSLVAMLLFATAAPLVAYAGIAKHYSIDVCVAVLFSWLALELIAHPVTQRKAWAAAIAGAILQWFSQTGVLMAVGLACPVILWLSTDPPGARRRRVVVVLAFWGASALGIAMSALATITDATRDYLQTYWVNGFPPASLATEMSRRWPWPNIESLFGSSFGEVAALGYPLSPLYPALAVIGAVILLARKHRVGFILFAPLVVTLGAAAAHQYPFSGRLILFLVPALLIALAAVSAAVYHVVERFSKPAALMAVAALTIPPLAPVVRSGPPYRIEDITGVLRFIEARRQRDDDVYVYYGAAPAMSAYDSAFGLSRTAYTVGGCHRGDSQRYLEELDSFRGRSRVWVVVLTHGLPGYRERGDIVAYLDTIGTRVEYVTVASRYAGWTPPPAEGLLYDLSSATRLASADARTFKLTSPSGGTQPTACRHGPVTMIPSDFECNLPPHMGCTRRPVTGSWAAGAEVGH